MKICTVCNKIIISREYDGRCSCCQQKIHDVEISRILEYASNSEKINIERDRKRLVTTAKKKLKSLGISNPSEREYVER
jgi:hypothetical protein